MALKRINKVSSGFVYMTYDVIRGITNTVNFDKIWQNRWRCKSDMKMYTQHFCLFMFIWWPSVHFVYTLRNTWTSKYKSYIVLFFCQFRNCKILDVIHHHSALLGRLEMIVSGICRRILSLKKQTFYHTPFLII